MHYFYIIKTFMGKETKTINHVGYSGSDQAWLVADVIWSPAHSYTQCQGTRAANDPSAKFPQSQRRFL